MSWLYEILLWEISKFSYDNNYTGYTSMAKQWLIINESQTEIFGVNKCKNCEAHLVLHKSFNYY